MQNFSDRYRAQPVAALPKRIGSYLVDAGLLTADQIMVILNDQRATGMRFGEIAVARGWLKEQTVEWIVQKVIEPERTQEIQVNLPKAEPLRVEPQKVASGNRPNPAAEKTVSSTSRATSSSGTPSGTTVPPSDSTLSRGFTRREAPISKPLPSVKSSDGDVNWVG